VITDTSVDDLTIIMNWLTSEGAIVSTPRSPSGFDIPNVERRRDPDPEKPHFLQFLVSSKELTDFRVSDGTRTRTHPMPSVRNLSPRAAVQPLACSAARRTTLIATAISELALNFLSCANTTRDRGPGGGAG
jgi:hypothetical protein